MIHNIRVHLTKRLAFLCAFQKIRLKRTRTIDYILHIIMKEQLHGSFAVFLLYWSENILNAVRR